jgi:ABC-type polysaccharide/polyol phosphate transport system ATPase subunit
MKGPIACWKSGWRAEVHRHQTFDALDDISFQVRQGECFGIIGENGGREEHSAQ